MFPNIIIFALRCSSQSLKQLIHLKLCWSYTHSVFIQKHWLLVHKPLCTYSTSIFIYTQIFNESSKRQRQTIFVQSCKQYSVAKAWPEKQIFRFYRNITIKRQTQNKFNFQLNWTLYTQSRQIRAQRRWQYNWFIYGFASVCEALPCVLVFSETYHTPPSLPRV